jgi:hypothetical protein
MAVFVRKVGSALLEALTWDVAGWRIAPAKTVDNIDVNQTPLRWLNCWRATASGWDPPSRR